MTINSMTGFARATGASGHMSWQWELKSVNGKALDVRLRLPPGLEHLEAALRAKLGNHIKRGNVQVSLTVSKPEAGDAIRVNEGLLHQLADLAEKLRAKRNGPPVQAEHLLGLRGVLEVAEHVVGEDETAARDHALVTSFAECVTALVAARAGEGQRLKAVLTDQIARITELAAAATVHPSRAPEAIKTRLREQVARLMEASASFDEARLHQEAVLLATRVDIQEELDRLSSHIEAAQELLASREPVGRKFDFLAQEFNREANTLCSKANEKTLTTIGLDLKTVIDQMREQVQNIE